MSESTSGNRRRLVWLAGASAATALLLALTLPPAEWSFLAWVALVPMLLALRVRLDRAAVVIVWLAGMAFGIAGFSYIRHVSWLGMFLLGFYISVYFVVFGVVVRWLAYGKGLPLALAAPLVWTALEQIRGWFLTGLPYLLMAHSQYKELAVIQIADLAGAAGVTFWILAVNGGLADVIGRLGRLGCLARLTPVPRVRWVVAGAAAVLLVSAGALLYGRHRLQTVVTKNGPRVAVIQGNVPQDVKNVLTIENLAEIFARHLALTDRAQRVSEPPDLVIWPETMAPYGGLDPIEPGALEETDIERLTERQLFQRLCVVHLTPRQRWSDLLISSVCVLGDKDHPILHNSAYLLPRGKRGATVRYDKIHLVPFGEYVPLKGLIGWIVSPLIPYEHGVTPGAGPKLFECKGWRFAPTICYEDAFAGLVADFARGPEKMDFIVNVTNEGWFKDGIELDQHLAIAVFRAIECRAGFIRAANTGISAFISPTGQVLSKLEVDGRDREVSGILHGFATATDVRSPYLTPLPWADSWVWAILGCRTAGQLFGSLTVLVLLVLWVLFALPAIRRKLRRAER